jgi:hypothetical protein
LNSHVESPNQCICRELLTWLFGPNAGTIRNPKFRQTAPKKEYLTFETSSD